MNLKQQRGVFFFRFFFVLGFRSMAVFFFIFKFGPGFQSLFVFWLFFLGPWVAGRQMDMSFTHNRAKRIVQ